METHDALLLWMTGDKRVQKALEAYMEEVSAILPVGFWAVPWPLLKHFKAMRTLTIGFPRFATHWVFAEMPAFEPFTQLTGLNLQSPSLIALIDKLDVSFPNLIDLTLFIEDSSTIMSKANWIMPPRLQSLAIKLREDSKGVRLLNLSYVPWLQRLSDDIHTIDIDLHLYLGKKRSVFKWPHNLTVLRCGFETEFPADFVELNESISVPNTPSTPEEEQVIYSATEYAKIMRAAKKADKESKPQTSTPTPSSSVEPAPVTELPPFMGFPRRLETAHIYFVAMVDMPAPQSLPPRIRSFRMSSKDGDSQYPLVQYYAARPTLTEFDHDNRGHRMKERTFLVSTDVALRELPPQLEALTISLRKVDIKMSEWNKHYPKHLTELEVHMCPYDRLCNYDSASAVLNSVPPKLRKVTLFAELRSVSIRFPDSVTWLHVQSARLKPSTVLPRSLKYCSMRFGLHGDLSDFPSCVTNLTLTAVLLSKFKSSSSFAAKHLPLCLRHLSITAYPEANVACYIPHWWASMPRDLPLETLSLKYYDFDTEIVTPRTLLINVPLPYIHPSLYSLSVALYEAPIELSAHVMENLPKQLKTLSFGIFNRAVRACPLLPDSAIDNLPPLLETLKTTVFDVAALKRWNRLYASRNGSTFTDSPEFYTFP